MNDGLKLQKKLELNFKEGEKIKVSPLGEVIGLDGRGYKIDGEMLLNEITKAGLHIPLDINHGFGEAIGWFDKESFEVRDDGLYGMLELNPKGQELVSNKSYRYLSPVYMMGDGGVVIGLDSVGLVNRPNLLNNELNEKEKTKKEKKLEELEKLQTEITTLKNEIETLKKGETQKEEKKEENSLNADIEAIKGAIKELNTKLSLVGGKTNLEENEKKVVLSENDKKVADLLGISHEEFMKSKENR